MCRLAGRPLLPAVRPVFLLGLAPQPVRAAHVFLSALPADREMVRHHWGWISRVHGAAEDEMVVAAADRAVEGPGDMPDVV